MSKQILYGKIRSISYPTTLIGPRLMRVQSNTYNNLNTIHFPVRRTVGLKKWRNNLLQRWVQWNRNNGI